MSAARRDRTCLDLLVGKVKSLDFECRFLLGGGDLFELRGLFSTLDFEVDGAGRGLVDHPRIERGASRVSDDSG